MGNVDYVLDAAAGIRGTLAVALVDHATGTVLGSRGGAAFDLEVAATGNSAVVRSKMDVVDRLGLPERIEDVLITLDGHYHLIRLIHDLPGASLFLYVVLDRALASLATARHELRLVEQQLFLSGAPAPAAVPRQRTGPAASRYYAGDAP